MPRFALPRASPALQGPLNSGGSWFHLITVRPVVVIPVLLFDLVGRPQPA